MSSAGQLTVEVENLGPEESNAGVNPLPVSCPLLLVDIGHVTGDIDSVLRKYDQRREDNSSGGTSDRTAFVCSNIGGRELDF